MKFGRIFLVVAAASLLLTACGAEKSEKIQMQVTDGYIQYYNGQEWENLISVEDLRGPQGIPGKDGQDGQDGQDGRDGQNGTDGQDGLPGVNGENGADGKDGTDGKDGKDGKDGTQAVACNHIYRQISQTVEHIEDYPDGGYLARRRYTMVCDLCNAEVQMYYDFEIPSFTPLSTSVPTPVPATPEPTPVSTPEPTPVSTPEPTPEPTPELMPGEASA